MIGQKQLLNDIDMLLSKSGLPQFVLLSGNRGSGRKLIASVIAQKIGGHIYNCGIKADEIRDMVDIVSKTTDTLIVMFFDADNMSVSAKNILLKITEEPPENAYFIMTLEDESNTLETIRSRSTTFRMNKYTPEEIEEYANSIVNYLNPEEVDILANICSTPGEVKNLISFGVVEFWEYVNKVINNIDSVSTANSFKIGSKIAIKDDKGFDLKLFWRAFMMICVERMEFERDEKLKYANWVRFTSIALQELRTVSVNKQMLFDSWVLDIRG